jgi:Mannosyl-glycoprotein endo-beta-N-acetylglucosaminidase
MRRVVKTIAGLVATLLLVAASGSAAFAQGSPVTVPTVTVPTPPSLPPGIPTVDPPVDPSAPPPPPVPAIPDPSPQVAVVMAKLHVLDTQTALTAAQAALDASKGDEARVRAQRDAAMQDRDAKRQVLTAVATDAYVNGGTDGTGADPLAEYVPVESQRLLTSSAVDLDVSRLHDAEDRLRAAERALADAVAKSVASQAARDAAQADVDSANQAVRDAQKLTNTADVSPTVMGDPVLTADEIVGWYKAQGITGYVGAVDLATMAGYYIDEGKAEQIRGDIAFAQSIVETGAFTSPLTTHNNFAGIGACDSCPTGFDFASPQLGVRAQAQLLHAYADKTLRVASLANPAVGSNPDHLSVRGCCTTWNKLTGTWASDPNYGPKLMTVYLSMLQYALTERSKPPPPDPASLPSLGPTPLPTLGSLGNLNPR